MSATQNNREGGEDAEFAKLSPQEQKLYKLYGKLPKKSDILSSKLKERKFFDSGDYAMSKAGIKSIDIDTSNDVKPNSLNTPELPAISRINRNSISGGSSGSVSGSIRRSLSGGRSHLEQKTVDDSD